MHHNLCDLHQISIDPLVLRFFPIALLTEVSANPDPDDDTMYNCDYESDYSIAVQEPPLMMIGLPEKSTFVCGSGSGNPGIEFIAIGS